MPIAKPQQVAVLGAGPAGLFAAHFLAGQGARVALFESHSKPGGCASFFRRRVRGEETATFDAGATVLNRLGAGEFVARALQRFGVAPAGNYAPMRSIRMVLPGEPARELRCDTLAAYLDSLRAAFPVDRGFIERVLVPLARHAERMAAVIDRVPHLPIQTSWDLRRDLELAPALFATLPAFAMGLARDFGQVIEGASPRLRRWIEMNLLITLQCSPREAHPLYGALGFFFYALGAGTLDGGMKSLFLPLLEALKARADAKVYMRTAVLAIEPASGQGYVIRASAPDENKIMQEREYGPFDAVFSSLPRFGTQALVAESVDPANLRLAELEPELWSAFVGYFVLEDEDRFPAEAFHVHASRVDDFDAAPDGGDVYLSFSRRGDEPRVPPGMRSATLSTHVRMPTTRYFAPDFAKAEKAKLGREMLAWAIDTAYPGAKIAFEEYGSPRTFFRYTRRPGGTVGGLPLSRRHAFFAAPPQRTRLKNLYQIGDTAFPGQSVYACAVGAAAAVEKFFGARLAI